MAVKFHHHCFLSSSTSAHWVAQKLSTDQYLYRVADFDCTTSLWARSGKRSLGCTDFEYRNNSYSYRYQHFQKHNLLSQKSNRGRNPFPCAAADDGVTVSGSPEASTSRDVEAMRIRLDQALKNEDYIEGLVQSLYDAARVFELSLKERSSLSKISWFPLAWLGVDKNAWTKALSYQASVYALLKAANEISSADARDRDINVVVQRSLLRLSAPLETIIREKFSGKQPEDFEWFWSDQIPVVVTTFVNYFERDPSFKDATMSGKRMPLGSGNGSDIAHLVLALRCCAVITKLGQAKVLCSQLFSMIPDITGSLMDELVGLVPMHEAYRIVKEIGLHKEFLIHFGPRVASCGVTDDCVTDEMVFWVDLVQKQLQKAIDREKLWSRLTTPESIEVLEKDLAIFGFFIALGRRTRAFLVANGFDKLDEPIESFIRYLVGGCILHYPQLSSISSYELYVEVVCEELDWLPFYPGYSNTIKHSHGHKRNSEEPPNAKSVSQALEICSRWIRVFIKHSKWVQNPANVKAARFLSKGHDMVGKCREEMGLLRDEFAGSKALKSIENEACSDIQSRGESNTFDKALESVEEALLRLENLLQEMHTSNSHSGKEHLKAACSDLEKIRKLKNEAEFFEASFRAKAASLQEENDDGESLSPNEERKFMKEKDKGHGAVVREKNRSNPGGLWTFLIRSPEKQPASGSPKIVDRTIDKSSASSGKSNVDTSNSETDEIQRFEVLRSELMELEKRVQRSNTEPENDKDVMYTNDVVKGAELIPVQKNASFIEKSLNKVKETSTDVWQGTQLLAIDTATAMGLLRRAIVGDELTEKEMKILRRTLTDLASVVPIGVLMLLPVTAVGHAAMLAAIQRYFPALIPSTYGSERLDLLRQLEKMKQTDIGDPKSEDNVEELA